LRRRRLCPTGNADEIAARIEAIAAAEAVATALKTAGLLVVEGLVAGTEYSVTVEAFNTHTTTVGFDEWGYPTDSETTAHYLAASGTTATPFTPTEAGPNNAAVTLATIALPSSEKGVFAWDVGYPAGTAGGDLSLIPEGGDSQADSIMLLLYPHII